MAQLVAIFATTMGDRGERIVRDALVELQIAPDSLDESSMKRVLGHLATREGIIGVTARFAVTSRGRNRATGKLEAVVPNTGLHRRVPERERAHAGADQVFPEDIASAFGGSLDPEAALTLVRRYWIAARLTGTSCSRDQAMAILDAMSAEAGPAGVAATFAKARLYMRRG